VRTKGKRLDEAQFDIFVLKSQVADLYKAVDQLTTIAKDHMEILIMLTERVTGEKVKDRAGPIS
jgi:hypothetical protein